MMRSLRTVFVLVLVVNVVAVVAFAIWLGASGRVNRDRMDRVADIFKLTLAQEKALREVERQARAVEETRAAETARMAAAAGGPVSAAETVQRQQREVEYLRQMHDRLVREKQDIERQLGLARDELAKKQQELDVRIQAFESARQAEIKVRDDRDFQKAVELYQQLKPRQVKGAFQSLLSENKVDQVLDYLSAMQPRKAAAVLSEFKTPEEIPTAAMLIQKLRERGIEVLQPRRTGTGATGEVTGPGDAGGAGKPISSESPT